MSVCYGQCAVEWPPLLLASGQLTLAPGIPGQLGTTTRKDNTRQALIMGFRFIITLKIKSLGIHMDKM